AALESGASIVNDVAARLKRSAMWRIVSRFQAGYICMHAQGSPAIMQKKPAYRNVVRTVGSFFEEHLRQLPAAGIAPEQIIFDPGIGFGKNSVHNLQLL